MIKVGQFYTVIERPQTSVEITGVGDFICYKYKGTMHNGSTFPDDYLDGRANRVPMDEFLGLIGKNIHLDLKKGHIGRMRAYGTSK